MRTELPTGRRGQAMALGLTLLVLAALWCAAVVPLWGWYEDRAEQLRERRAYATRMAALAAQVPALRRRAASLGGTGPSPDSILRGDTDAIAGAALQDAVRSLAGRQGITLASTETLPAAPLSHYRRIGVRISLAAPYSVLVRLLQAIDQATPRMLIDDLQVQAPQMMHQPVDPALAAQVTVLAFRDVQAPGPVLPLRP